MEILNVPKQYQSENIYVESTKGKNILNVKSAKNLKVDGETYEEIDAKGQILNFK